MWYYYSFIEISTVPTQEGTPHNLEKPILGPILSSEVRFVKIGVFVSNTTMISIYLYI